MLIVWPRWSTFALLYSGERGLQRACAKLEATAAAPGADELSIAHDILASPYLAHHAPRIAQAVCQAASLWGDAQLWARAVERCCAHAGLATIPDDRKFAALERFGWGAVRVW